MKKYDDNHPHKKIIEAAAVVFNDVNVDNCNMNKLGVSYTTLLSNVKHLYRFVQEKSRYPFFKVVVFSLAIVSVLAIVISITLTADRNRNNEGFVADGDPISLEEFITSKFSPSYFNGSWWSSHQLQWRDEVNNLVVWDVETQETSLLVSSDTVGLVSSSATFIAFGKNKSLLLFKDDVESVWRHSFLAQYFVLDVTKNETLAVTPMNLPDGTKLQYAQWVPQTDKVAYVFGNDIYIRDILNGGEDVQITSDGVIDTIYNGIPDWVYEEEILSTNKAMYFTPSGSKMAFARFNDEDVQEFYYTKYGSPEDPYKVQVRPSLSLLRKEKYCNFNLSVCSIPKKLC